MACRKGTHHLLEASRGDGAICQEILGEKRNLSDLVWGRSDDIQKCVYEGSEINHDLGIRNQGGLLELDSEAHSKMEQNGAEHWCLWFSPFLKGKLVHEKDIVYVWEHRHDPEVEVGGQWGQQFGDKRPRGLDALLELKTQYTRMF